MDESSSRPAGTSRRRPAQARLGWVLALALAGLAATAVAAPAANAPVAGTIDMGRPTNADTTAGGRDQRFVARRDESKGLRVAFAGDFNGDGRQDYAFGMPRYSTGGGVAVVYGPPAKGRKISIPRLGRPGVRILGPGGARAGSSVAGAGDVNRDGFDDLLIGAPEAAVTGRGTPGIAYVVFGGPRPLSGRLLLGQAPGVRIMGAAPGGDTGTAVAKTGDLDGDLVSDLVVGDGSAADNGRPDAGAAFVIYSSALTADVDLANLAGGGYRIDGAAPGDDTGDSVSGVGDMNGDGLAEVVVGSPSASGNAGAASVIFGRPAGVAATRVDLAALGASGFTVRGSAGERAGTAVAGLDDVTGDGLPDVAVGAPRSGWNGRTRSGAAYVAPGRAAPGISVLPAGGLRVGGGDSKEALGAAVAPAGDVDDDGTPDLLIGLGGENALGRTGAGAVIVLLLGRVPRSGDVDGALFGYAAMRLAGPWPKSGTGQTIAGDVDADGDGRPDVLVGQPQRPGVGQGGAVLVLLPAPPGEPQAQGPTGDVRVTNVEVIVDDSGSLNRYDKGGTLRRQALERMLVDPANQDRVLGAVEFGTRANQILPPLRIADSAIAGARLDVLRALLAERIRSNAGNTNFNAGLDAASLSNGAAQARILLTDEGRTRDFAGFGAVPTFVVALGAARGSRLEQLARASGGEFYPVRDGGELQSAIAAIDARLRGEAALRSSIEDSSKGVSEARPAVAGEVAAAITRPNAQVEFVTTAPASRARRLRRARMVTTWDKRGSSFRLSALRFRLGSARLKVRPGELRRAMAGRWQNVGRGLQIRGRIGRTYLILNVRGLNRAISSGHAQAAALGYAAYARYIRTRGSRRTIARSRWTSQRRPT